MKNHHLEQSILQISECEELFAVQESMVVKVIGVFALFKRTHPAVTNADALQVDIDRVYVG